MEVFRCVAEEPKLNSRLLVDSPSFGIVATVLVPRKVFRLHVQGTRNMVIDKPDIKNQGLKSDKKLIR